MADLVTNKLDFGGNDAFVLQDARVDSMYTNAQIDTALATKADTSDIPTVNNSTITIKQGTTTKGTFTLNQSSPATITLDEGGSQIDTLGDIGDVNLVDLADGQQIHWDADTQKWINAEGVEFRTLTQAQYDALPNSKLTDGVFYYIIDSTDEEFIDDDVTSSVKTWSSEKIASTMYGKGTHTLPALICAGYVTGSGNYLDFFIPMHIANGVTSATINSFNSFAMYGASGLIQTSFTQEAIVVTPSGLRVEARLSSTYSPKSSCASVAYASASVTLA